MGYDYGGLLSLAQTALAINMAYIALDRFRYRAQIRDRAASAQSQTDGFKDAFVDDRAWDNVQRIATANDARAWIVGRPGYYVYRIIFRRSVDIAASYLFSLIAVLTMLWHSYGGISMDEAVGARIWPGSALLDSVVLVILIAGTIAPVAFVLAGQYAVRCASRSIEDNMAHLTRRYSEAVSDKLGEKLKGLPIENENPN